MKISTNDILAIITIVAINSMLPVANYDYQKKYVQAQVQAQPQQSQTDSNGNLTATINGTEFKAGETIKISGTVAKEGIGSGSDALMGVIGPNNKAVESTFTLVDQTTGEFEYTFVAGLVQKFDPNGPIREGATIRLE
jgi:hypothetical protein